MEELKHEKYLHLRLVIFAVIVSIIASGCGPPVYKYNIDQEGFPAKIVTGKKAVEPALEEVNFFLETSGSMKGFMPNNQFVITQFQKVIPDLLSRINENSILKFYSISDSKSKLTKESITQVNNQLIPKGAFNWSGDTELPIIMDSLSKYRRLDKVSIFVSDCIYSPHDKELTAQTIASIRSVFMKSANNYDTFIYCLKSDFFYKGRPTIVSPYYLIIQGSSDNVNFVKNLLLKTLNTFEQHYQDIDFGSNMITPYYSILPYTETSGNFIAAQGKNFNNSYVSLQDIDLSEKDIQTKFWLAMNLKELPAYAQSIHYLEDNIIINCSGGKISKIKIVNDIDKLNHDDEVIRNKSTVFVQLEIDEIKDNCALLEISLKKRRPGWIALINSDDPATMNNDRSHTFGLKSLIEGISQAYDTRDKDFFFQRIQISLIKKQ